MRRALSAGLVIATASAAAALGADIDRTAFRYTRPLTSPSGGPVRFIPDSPLLGHARVGFGDLRVLDGSGAQVPWRPFPSHTPVSRRVTVLNAGVQEGAAVATLDLGPSGEVHDTLALDIPGLGFVATATVFGADRRDGARTRLGATKVYDVTGARHERSTIVEFAPTNFRYLFVRVPGVPAIRGAVVTVAGAGPRLVRRPAHVTVRDLTRTTQVTLDLGYPHIPISLVRLTSATLRYFRDVDVAISSDGAHYLPGTSSARVFSFRGASNADVPVDERARSLRLTISNGDDPPLRGLRATAYDAPRLLLAEGGHTRPYRLFYGSTTVPAPDYDLARLPDAALGLERAVSGRLGAEALNPVFRAAPDTRSFAAKHGWVVNGALALAACVVAAGGLVALRRR